MKCLIAKLEHLLPFSSLSTKSIIFTPKKLPRHQDSTLFKSRPSHSWHSLLIGQRERRKLNTQRLLLLSKAKPDWHKLLHSACMKALFLSLNQKTKTVTFSTLLTSSAARLCLQPEMSFVFRERSPRLVSCTVHQLLIYPTTHGWRKGPLRCINSSI